MNLHEYQSKQLFAEYAIPVPKGEPAGSPEEAVAAARRLGPSPWVVKAQIHAGGRGKAGGVKLAKDLNSVAAATRAMLGTRLVTHQTGPEGLPVHQVYVEAGLEHRPGNLPEPRAQPRGEPASRASRPSRRHGYRRGCRTSAREDHSRRRAPDRGPAGLSVPVCGLRLTAAGRANRPVRPNCPGTLRAVPGPRCEPRRNQSLDRQRRRRSRRARCEDQYRGQRIVPPQGTRGHARCDPGGPDGAPGRRSTTSTTSRSTAISPAWSTARVSRWRPWI